MRTSNFGNGRRASVFFRLCLVTIVVLSLAMGGMALNPLPVRAAFDIAPPAEFGGGWSSPILRECVHFSFQFTTSGNTCSTPPENVFFWTLGTVPGWAHLDSTTGILSGCPDQGSTGAYTFQVFCTELCNHCPGCAWCPLPFCFTFSTFQNVTLNVTAPWPCITAINATYYPVAWENVPFAMTLAATGGFGPFNWTATGLPNGLSVTDAANGIISGTPAPGTCGIYTVTATVTDAGMCYTPNCPCAPISRDFILIVDCWANYPPIFYPDYSACDFTVEIGSGLTQGQTNVLVDGAHEATLIGGQSHSFTSVPCESHLVMVDQTVQVPNSNIKFTVIGSNTKTVTDTDNHAYFDYAQQVNITTASEPAGVTQPPGAGFYAVGSNFSSTTPGTIETDIQNGKKLVFREWRLFDGTTRPTTNLGFIIPQGVGGTVTAVYDTYYQLTLKSDYPAIDERSFEPAGSTASWNLSLHAVPLLGFWGFLGGVQSPLNASGSQLITGPTTVEIQWAANYTMPIIAIIIALLVIAGLIVLIFRLRSRPAAKTEVKEATPKAKKSAAKSFCSKCGASVDKDADFCKKCGKKLK